MIKTVQPPAVYGEQIVKVCSNFCYLFEDEHILDASRFLSDSKKTAAAVVTHELKVIGLIQTAEMLELLGKPFGRDLLQRKNIGDIAKKARCFLYNEHIQEISENVQDDFHSQKAQYYILVDSKRKYCGLFSSRDLLVYSVQNQQRDLALASSIQNKIVPRFSQHNGHRCTFVCTSLMSQSVGGDYYYVKEYETGKWFFCLCDISGKGVSAAILTAVMSGFMVNLDYSLPLDQNITALNKLILNTFSLQKYLTGIFIQFDEHTGRMLWCDMGHGLMCLIRQGRMINSIAEEDREKLPSGYKQISGSVPVGVIENPEIVQFSAMLEKEDILFLYTDGLIEQKNLNGDEYNVANLVSILQTSADDLKKTNIALFEDFAVFKGSAVQHDDVSCVLLRFN